MITAFAEPLPNDLLRNPPWPETMASRRIDDALLSIIDASENDLREAGYEFQYGTEVNLGILSPAEAAKLQNNKRRSVIGYWRQACREQFARDLNTAAKVSYHDAATEIYSQLESIATHREYQSFPENETWLEQWHLAKTFYAQGSASGESKKTVLARKCFLIAMLHLLPPHLGGVRGLIEQRFSNAHYGYGWWDGKNIIELRNRPVQGYENAITNYHHVLWQMRRAFERFGFVPVIQNAIAQVHFSLWRISDNINIMASDGEEEICTRLTLADTMNRAFQEFPLSKFQSQFEPDLPMGEASVGASRISTLRTCDDNWELRFTPLFTAGMTHLAKDIYCITSAAGAALQEKRTTFAKGTLPAEKTREWIEDLYEEYFDAYVPENYPELIRRLRIVADLPRVACPFVSTLEAAIISGPDKDNIMYVPKEVFDWNKPLLMKAIGEHSYDLFSVTSMDGRRYNLSTAKAWAKLFENVRITDDGTLDVSALHPSLRTYFKGLKVASIKDDVFMPEPENIYVDLDEPNDYANIAKAHFLAEGKLVRHGDQLLPAQREIFGFVRQQYTTLDPQEAVYYMLWLHEIALEDRQAPGKFVVVPENAQDRQHIDSVVARAGSQFFNDALGTWLLHGIKYYFHRCNEIAPYFEEADILKTALSYRENALAALPVAASHRPFKERAFFKGLETYISDPLKFFAFEHMIPFFEVTSKKALYVSMPYCDVESDGSNSILGLEDHEVTDFSELLRDDGKRIGMSTVKIVAAMQRTADDETNILNQYLAQAASLTDKLKTAEQIRMAVLEGLQAGVVEEAQRLLGDRSELALLRHKTIEGMRTCP